MAKQWTGKILGDGSGDRPSDQVHLTNELNASFGLFIKLKHEAKYIASVDQADDDDVSRVRDLVLEDCLADARLDKLRAGSRLGAVGRSHLPGAASERIEVPVVVFQDLQLDQAFQTQVDDRLGMMAQLFNPVLGVASSRSIGYFREDRIQHRVARFGSVKDEKGFHVSVDVRPERKFREHCAYDCAVQVPPWHLVEVATLLVEKGQDEFFGQSQLMG